MNARTRRVVVTVLSGLLITPALSDPAQSAMIPPPTVEAQIESRLQSMKYGVLTVVANDSQVRALTRNVVSRQFDGDTNALLSTVMAEAESSGIVNPSDPRWQSLKSSVQNFVVNGYRYDPQVYIPNYGEGALPGSFVELAVAPANETLESVPGYRLDSAGNVVTLPYPINEVYTDTHEVWVLSVNERVNAGVPVARAGAGAGTNAVCNPTGIRNNQGQEYLYRWRVPNKSSFGSTFEGKREMKLIVLTSSGATLKTTYFGKVKRKHIDSWQYPDLFITTWDRAVWGDVMAYQWYEVDGGSTTTTAINVPIQGGGSISTSVTTQERDDDGGNTAVLFSESTYLEYSTGLMRFQMCSQGGDGGTGNENLACGALASASTTFSGYSPARTTDCNPDTRLGGAYSWANANGTYAPNNPQWVQADFGVNKTFRRVVVFTSQGYPIRDYDVQVWNGAVFVTVAAVRGNTALTVTSTFPAQTSRLVRILGFSGPNHQQTYVRVNELQVFAV